MGGGESEIMFRVLLGGVGGGGVGGTAINTDRVRLLCRRQHKQVRVLENTASVFHGRFQTFYLHQIRMENYRTSELEQTARL